MAHRESNFTRRALTAGLLTCVLVVALAPMAGADLQSGSGNLSADGNVSVELASDGGGAGGGGGGGRGRSRGSAGTWVGYDVGVCGAGGEQWFDIAVNDLGPPDPPAFEPAGVIRNLTLIRPDGSIAGTYLWSSCAGPPPAAPPSADDALAAADLPVAGVPTSPEVTGLVGIENWFWYEGPTEVPVTVTLDGWTGTATARAVAWRWDFGDGAAASSTTPGSPDDPAVTHVYTTKGTKRIVLTVTWEADFTLTGFGLTVQSGLGSIDLGGATRDYVVEEREAVVVG